MTQYIVACDRETVIRTLTRTPLPTQRVYLADELNILKGGAADDRNT